MGLVEIMNNRVTLLVETAEHPEEIDMARAKEAKERAEEQMRQKQSIREYYHSRASLARAMARIKAASANKDIKNIMPHIMLYVDNENMNK